MLGRPPLPLKNAFCATSMTNIRGHLGLSAQSPKQGSRGLSAPEAQKQGRKKYTPPQWKASFLLFPGLRPRAVYALLSGPMVFFFPFPLLFQDKLVYTIAFFLLCVLGVGRQTEKGGVPRCWWCIPFFSPEKSEKKKKKKSRKPCQKNSKKYHKVSSLFFAPEKSEKSRKQSQKSRKKTQKNVNVQLFSDFSGHRSLSPGNPFRDFFSDSGPKGPNDTCKWSMISPREASTLILRSNLALKEQIFKIRHFLVIWHLFLDRSLQRKIGS